MHAATHVRGAPRERALRGGAAGGCEDVGRCWPWWPPSYWPWSARFQDCGSDLGNTTQILDLLRREAITAAFGVTGRFAEVYPAAVHRMIADGHQLINHSYDHPSFTTLSTQQRNRQLDRTEQIFAALGGTSAGWFRPPYFDRNAAVDTDLAAHGYLELLASIDTLGWRVTPRKTTPQEIVTKPTCIRKIAPGRVCRARWGDPIASGQLSCDRGGGDPAALARGRVRTRRIPAPRRNRRNRRLCGGRVVAETVVDSASPRRVPMLSLVVSTGPQPAWSRVAGLESAVYSWSQTWSSTPDIDVRTATGESGISLSGWVWRYDGFDPASEGLREALCALGNGRFMTRAAAPEARADEVHYPGTYAAGVFNRLAEEKAGRWIENESIVNLPDWQSLRFRAEDGDWVDLATSIVDHYVQELDLRRGILTRRFRVVDAAGRRTAVAQRRFVSMADPYLACLDATFVAENWSGPLIVRSGIDGRVANSGVPRYRGLADSHLVVACGEQIDDDIVALTAVTTQSVIRVSLAARQRVLLDDQPVKSERLLVEEDGYIGQDIPLDLKQGERHTVEKVVALYTSRDRAISEPGRAARDKARRAPDLPDLLARHVLTWDHLWERCDLRISGHERADQVLHLHLFQLLQTLSAHSVDLDVGIPARGLHGEAYRGHIFWDANFVFPYLNLRMPELSRALLLYRWRRLPQARQAAREIGCRGAMFPWQSGSDGREETQTLHLNPRSGRWNRDHSHLQRHINAAIAYSTWKYYEATGDTDFLAQHGAEILFEVAKFWSSLATYDRADDRFDLRGVMGPDEYHDGYPWRDEPGIDNNAYTNVMVVWVLIARAGMHGDAARPAPRGAAGPARHHPGGAGALGAPQPQASAVLAR